MDFPTKSVLILFFSVTVEAILNEGYVPSTKPPLRQEILWNRRAIPPEIPASSSKAQEEIIFPARVPYEHSNDRRQKVYIPPNAAYPIKQGAPEQPSVIDALLIRNLTNNHASFVNSSKKETFNSQNRQPEINNERKLDVRDKSVTQTSPNGCIPRAHSWGCDPVDRGHKRFEGTSENGNRDGFKKETSESVISQFRSSPSNRGAFGGWRAMEDWCLFPTGQFPYPLDCRRFVNCWNGRGYVQPCAPGTLFNSETSECDFPTKVKGCNTRKRDLGVIDGDDKVNVPGREVSKRIPSVKPTTASLISEKELGKRMLDIIHFPTQNLNRGFGGQSIKIQPTSTTPYGTTTPKIKSKSSKNVKFQLSCPESNGLFPHPQYCDQFINCHHGRPHAMKCGPGTLFHPTTKQCDHARNVKCSTADEDLVAAASNYAPDRKEFKSETTRTTKANNYTPAPREIESETLRNVYQKPPVIHEKGSRSITEKLTTITTAPTITSASTPTVNPVLLPKSTRDIEPFEPKDEFLQGSQPSTPLTGQMLRLRGGSGPWEGYVEVYWFNGEHWVWSSVCDQEVKWNLNEGSVVCRHLGYQRGADITWQGKYVRNNEDSTVPVDKIECSGSENSFFSCRLEPQNSTAQCNLGKRATGVRCLKDFRSLCNEREIPFAGHCYSIVKGSEKQPLITRESAAKECEKNEAHLANIISQEENDFISEWLMHEFPNLFSLVTGGVRMKMGQTGIWMWENSQFAFTYTNWWKGWSGNETLHSDLDTKCLVISRKFPCQEGRSRNEELIRRNRGRIQPRWSFNKDRFVQRPLMCKSEYYFWTLQDCNSLTEGAICKRNPNDIGCVWHLGMDYYGKANVTRNGNSCIQWNDGPFGSPHPDNRLQNHNLCRNFGGADGSQVGEGHPWCYIDSSGNWESCDIPSCINENGDLLRRVVSAASKKCNENEFECNEEECIENRHVCDGVEDCSNGNDEKQCTKILKEFQRREGMKFSLGKGEGHHGTHILEKWIQLNVEECAKQCLKKNGGPKPCTSFSYHLKEQQCWLIGKKVADSLPELEKKHGWDHYELLLDSSICYGMFTCKNGSCIDPSLVCNGKNDCGDYSDEMNCTSDGMEFSIRLTGGNSSNEGRIEVKVFGHWGVICDDLFGLADADVACREAGYNLGAAEVVLHSGFGSGGTKETPLFLMDDVECKGTENSLRHCLFPGWGIHDCGPEEVAGVVCKIPGTICQDDQFHCHHSKECIPLDYLCDNVADCDDASDEATDFCQSKVEIRLSGGPTTLEGRVEVRYRGIWGTICDDDFGITDAQVICRSLGLGWGEGVQALKESHYGPGKGPIWLDELHCSGDEETLLDCPRFPWGKNNCGHKEDASVKCTAPGNAGVARKMKFPKKEMNYKSGEMTYVSAKDILPSDCGIQDNVSEWLDAFSIKRKANSPQPRVLGGSEFKLGPIPWQASLRVKSHAGKSVHWCGAIVLSPFIVLTAGHCLQDYTKEAYVVRVGDFDSVVDEGNEQEITIEEVYLHEEFNKGTYLNHDIAVIKLKKPGMDFGQNVHGICLPEQEEESIEGAWSGEAGECIISGWGSAGGQGSGYSRTLRTAVIPLISPSLCKSTHVYGKDVIGKGMGCAGSLTEGGSDACQGDSGGPLICFEGGQPILYGITSWGQGCGRANKPGVYSRVAFYREWIDQKLREAMLGL